MIIGVGILLTIKTRFAQFKLFPRAVWTYFLPNSQDRSRRRALYTALAATVGTGNLAGVAGAIALGGPGAVFWIWISGLLGMATKMAEATLAVHYRQLEADGSHIGGPMYMILKVMKKNFHWLAFVYCFFGIVASFGVGNGTQVNAVVSGVNATLKSFGLESNALVDLLIGVCLGLLILFVFLKDSNGVGTATERLVPFAALCYVLLCVLALIENMNGIPDAIRAIFTGAFTPKAVTGGAIGSFFIALRVGMARGVFTNEAGMGTASIAHATADVVHPVEQGLMGIVEVFIDTIVICTLTALVILSCGVPISYGHDSGVALTTIAFVDACGQWASVAISLCLCLFALATVLGWGFYGLQCAKFLFGQSCIKNFVWMQAIVAVVSAMMQTETLWLFAEIINGLMAIPNLIILIKLSPEVVSLINDFKVWNYRRKKQADY
jgi:AGCS family alanine or glycine:cation symporter